MAIRCFCPPDKDDPLVPTMVSYPEGRLWMKSKIYVITEKDWLVRWRFLQLGLFLLD